MTATAVAQKQAPPTVSPSRLAIVKKQRLRAPLRYLIYGSEGTGKSTLASGAPDPIWFDVEDGSARLDVARYPFRDGDGGHVPHSYADIVAAIEDLVRSPHSFKTLVIDTVDRLEAMIWKHILERESQPSAKNKDGALNSIESFGFGKGYTMAVDEWRALCMKLDRLRAARGMSVVLIAHSFVKAFKNPSGPDYDRFQPAMHDKAAGFLKGWSDVTGFVVHEDDAAKPLDEGKNAKAKGYSTGRRLLKLSHSAAFDAKSRIALPDEVEIELTNPWGPLAVAVEVAFENQIPKLVDAIKAEADRVGDDELSAKVAAMTAAAVKAEDSALLLRYLTGLKNRPSKSEVQS